jgi:phage N-6-adenine-methyltransferase
MLRKFPSISKRAGDLAQFKPELARHRDIEADFIIDFAKATKDWPLLERAVDKKIEDQQKFVAWWGETVRPTGPRPINADPRLLTLEETERLTGITLQKVSKWKERLRDLPAYREKLYGVAWKAAMAETAPTRGNTGDGEIEWYTPGLYVELARELFGEIDLDPASSDKAQETVKATRYFTKEDDGLTKEWRGNVWLNPPYARDIIPKFMQKLVDEYIQGGVNQAVVLTNNYTDTEWFHLGAKHCSAICFTKGRVAFLDPEDNEIRPTQGQAFFYFGNLPLQFKAVFESIGFVVMR